VVAQVEIGTDASQGTTTSYPAVFGNFYRGARHQILFQASELVNQGFAGGTFNQLAFNIGAVNGTSQYFGFSVKIGCTTLNELNQGDWIDGLTTVFYADTLNITTGWNTLVLNPGFDWPGGVNIVIETCFDHFPLGLPYTQNSPTLNSTTPFISVIQQHTDQGGACDVPTGFIAASESDQRPNMRFLVCAGVNESLLSYTWSPAVGLDDPNSPSPIVTPQSSPVTYTVTVGDANLGCFATADLTIGWYPNPDVSFTPNRRCIPIGRHLRQYVEQQRDQLRLGFRRSG
jgi:hypothetical protein